MTDGGNIQGSDTNTLTIFDFSEDDVAFYSVAVLNPGGSLISGSTKVSIISADATIDDGLIAHFKMDGNANNTGSDGFNGTIEGASSFVTGKVGDAISLDGFNNYIFVEDYSDIEEEVTISMWVNIDPAVLNGFDVPTFIRNASGEIGVSPPLEQFEFGLQFNNNDSLMRLSAAIAAGPNIVRATDPTEFPLGSWQHVAFTADGGQVRVYRNGNLVATSSDLDDINAAQRPWLSIGAKLTEDDFGIFPDLSLPDFFTGQIDDVAIWRTAWSKDTIASIYELGNAGSDVTAVTIPIPPIVEIPRVIVEEPVLTIVREGTTVTVDWTNGTLQTAPSVSGPWTDAAGASSPLTEEAADSVKVYRAVE
jgi:hypothetical protein